MRFECDTSGTWAKPALIPSASPVETGQQRSAGWLVPTRGLGRKLGAALATTGCQDGAAGTGAHAKTETVLLGAATVVWLERAL